MWTSILSALLPFAVKIIQNYFEKQKGKQESKRKWIAFIESMAGTLTNSAGLRKSWQDQADRLKDQMDEPTEKAKKTPLKPYRNREALLKAAGEIGVKEIAGRDSNPTIEEYHRYSTDRNDKAMTDDVPWCASFVCWVVEKVGMGSTNSKMARSFEGWGVSVLDDPLPGDIVTFYRNGRQSGLGHVGFFVKKQGGHVYVLGGNQSDEVNVTRYSTARMTDIRRSSKAGTYSTEQRQELLAIAEDILAGNSVEEAGKVT